MVMTQWDPWSELAAVQRDIQELFGRRPQAGQSSNLVPPMDAYRTDEGLVLTLELPGLTSDQVEVNFARGVLTVSGERAVSAEVDDDAWLRRERPVGNFSRSITLPEGTDPEAIRARFENGVLELRIPHSPEQRTHRIPVSVGEKGRPVEVQG
jgi:HSP20 family protein